MAEESEMESEGTSVVNSSSKLEVSVAEDYECEKTIRTTLGLKGG